MENTTSTGPSTHSNLPRSDQPVTPTPSFAINDISLSLAASIPHISLPRLPLPSRTSSQGKPRRPSTASSAEERSARLPSSSSTSSDHHSSASTPAISSWAPSSLHADRPPPTGVFMEKMSLEEMNRRAHAAVAGLRAEASRLSAAGEFFFIWLMQSSAILQPWYPLFPVHAVLPTHVLPSQLEISSYQYCGRLCACRIWAGLQI